MALKPGSVRVDELKPRLRAELPAQLEGWMAENARTELATTRSAADGGARLSFEPADIVNEVMSFGSPTPVEVVSTGRTSAKPCATPGRCGHEMESRCRPCRDLQFAQAQDYPTVERHFDREKLGRAAPRSRRCVLGAAIGDLVEPVVVPNFWADPATGNGYQVQVQVPPPRMDTTQEVGMVPVKQKPGDGRFCSVTWPGSRREDAVAVSTG